MADHSTRSKPAAPETLEDLLRGCAFRWADEAELQAGVERVLVDAHLPFEREAQLSPRDRVHFLVTGADGARVVLELKVDGSLAEVTRQLHRYAQLPDVDAVMLVTTRRRHLALPDALGGKPLSVVAVGGIV